MHPIRRVHHFDLAASGTFRYGLPENHDTTLPGRSTGFRKDALMTTDGLHTRRRRTAQSRQPMQFAIGIVIAVAAVLGIEYALQQITQMPAPAALGSLSTHDPDRTASQTEKRIAARPVDPPGYATVRDTQPVEEPVEEPLVPLTETHPETSIRYFPVRGEAAADSRIAAAEHPGLPLQKPVPAEHPDPHGPSISTPARLAAPVPGHATPIRPGTNPHEERLRSIIRQELPRATADEHDIWLNALRGLDPRTVRHLLRLRQMIRDESPPITTGVSRRPEFTPPTGLARNKTTLPDVLSASRPLTGPPPTGRTRTIGRSGLSAQLVPEHLRSVQDSIRLACEVVLGNIANANTIAFKRRRVFFEDLASARVQSHERVGLGVQISQIRCDHSPGPLRTTRGPLDLAIDGDGFFQIQAGPEILYTRSGNFQLNADGEIVLKTDGRHRKLEPTITIPQDATLLVVSRNGTVSVRQPLVTDLAQIGTIQLARFVNPAGLESRGGNLFAPTGESGQPYLGDPETNGRGKVRQFCLEQSNVRLSDELQSLRRLQQQLLVIRQAAKILSESGDFSGLPKKGGPGPLVRETTPLTGPDGPRLSRQPGPQSR